MAGTYLSEKQIQKEKAIMQKRAMRSNLYGTRVAIKAKEGEISGLWYYQEGDRLDFVLVEVHGGGFMYNSAADDDNLCREIHERLKIPVLACDYRLTPEYKYPTGLEDVYACGNYATQHPVFGKEKPKVIFWGHSAGANLAAGAVYLAKERKEYKVACQILDYPYMDAYKTSRERKRIRSSVSGKLMDTFAHQYTADGDLKKPLISPVLMTEESLSGMPDTFLLLCGRDNLNQGGKDYGKLLKKTGVKVNFYYVRDALHGFIENYYNYPYVPLLTKLTVTKEQGRLAEEALSAIADWLFLRCL